MKKYDNHTLINNSLTQILNIPNFSLISKEFYNLSSFYITRNWIGKVGNANEGKNPFFYSQI